MLRHIGTIDNNLKKKIEEQLKNLKKGKNTASDISISEEIADLQALHLVEVSSSS
jgi:septation ring formation regulator EzrA